MNEVGPVELVRGGSLVLELGESGRRWGVEVRRSGTVDVTRIAPVEQDAETARLAPGRYELRLVAPPDPAHPDRPASPWIPLEIRADEETRLDLRQQVAELESGAR